MGLYFRLALFLFFLGFLLRLSFLAFTAQFLAQADELGGFSYWLNNGLGRRGHNHWCWLCDRHRLLLRLDERRSQLADFLNDGFKRVFL